MKPNDPFVDNIKHQLDAQELDKDTLQQLTNARYLALDGAAARKSFNFQGAALAFSLMLVISISVFIVYQPTDTRMELNNLDALEILTSKDDLEMFENLEFYLWLEEQQPLEKGQLG